MKAEELTPLEWQFQLYLLNLPIQDRAKFISRSDLSTFSIPELSAAFHEIRKLVNEAWANGAHRIASPEGAVIVHLDYIKSTVINAITFGSDGAYFVGITEPYLALFSESSSALWRADFLSSLLEIEMTHEVRDFLFQVFLLFQLQFISSHELGHLFHGHRRGSFREDFVEGMTRSGNSRMRDQAGELESDGYAVHLLLNGMLRSDSGSTIHRRLKSNLPMEDCVLTLFLLSVGALFFFLEPVEFKAEAARRLDHPFALARMNIVMAEIKSWCQQHLPEYSEWGSVVRFQWVMACVATVADSAERMQMWKDQGEFLTTDAGGQYLDDLHTEKLELRRSMEGAQWTLN